jgi:hypothetical protein
VQQDAFPGTLLAIDKRCRLPIDRSGNGATDADEGNQNDNVTIDTDPVNWAWVSQIRSRKRRKPVDDGSSDLPDFPQTGGSKPVISLTADDLTAPPRGRPSKLGYAVPRRNL